MATGSENKQANESESAVIDRVIGDSLKMLAVAGTFVYGALFIGYRAYYCALGIRPEDVGVNHAFILSRSIGFIFLATGVAALIALYAWIVRRHEGIRPLDMFGMAVVAVLVYLYSYVLLPTISNLWVDGLIFLGIGAAGTLLAYAAETVAEAEAQAATVAEAQAATVAEAQAQAEIGRRKADWNKTAWYAGLALTVSLTILLPAAAIGWRAHELGEKGLRGHSVTPFKILKIPVLDVSTEDVSAEWICPEGERPTLFGPAKGIAVEGTLLGETSTNVFVRLKQSDSEGDNYRHRSNTIIKLPQECVMLTRSRNVSDADAS